MNRALLQEIADNGGGRAYFTADPHNIPRIFTRETTTAMQSGVVEDYVEAARHFAEASRLHPQSWTIFRQSAVKMESGLASGPDFWARVEALRNDPYHLPINMKGIDR